MKTILYTGCYVLWLSLVVLLVGCNGETDLVDTEDLSEIETISIDQSSINESYLVGEIDITDWIITVTMNDDTTLSIPVDESFFSATDLTKLETAGMQTLTITYEGFTVDVTLEMISVPTYIVTFDLNGGILISGTLSQEIIENHDAVPPVFEKVGYDFIGFDYSYQSITEDVLLTAIWEIKTYDVSFDGDGGTLISGDVVQEVTYGMSAVEPTFEKEFHTFIGWDFTFDEVTDDLTVTALWEVFTYTVIFNPNGGTLVSGDIIQTIPYGHEAIPPTFYLDEEHEVIEWDNSFDHITEDILVTAIWGMKVHDVVFHLDGGTLISGVLEQEIMHNNGAIAPVIEKEGYFFYEWSQRFDWITEDINIYPVWIELIPGTEGLMYQDYGDNELEVTGYVGTDTTVFIPSMHEGKRVVRIGENAFSNNENVIQLTLQYGIKYIGFQGLAGMQKLALVNLPETLEIIEGFGLNGCASLLMLEIPASLTNIGYASVSSLNSLIEFVVSDNNPVYQAIDGILYSDNGTRLISVPGAKSGDIVIPDEVVDIDESAFSECSNVSSISFGSAVTEIPFLRSCESLTSIIVDSDNPFYTSIDGVLYNKDITTLVRVPRGIIRDITIPSTVTDIMFMACAEIPNMTSITFLSIEPPTLEEWVFISLAESTVIYVPADSLDSYLTAEGWSEYATSIEAITTSE